MSARYNIELYIILLWVKNYTHNLFIFLSLLSVSRIAIFKRYDNIQYVCKYIAKL